LAVVVRLVPLRVTRQRGEQLQPWLVNWKCMDVE
jgi:hypothetical protein